MGLVGGLWHGVCGGLLFCYLFWFDVGLRLPVLCLTCSVVYGLLLYVGGWVSWLLVCLLVVKLVALLDLLCAL